jgi:hypothetical protein
MFSLKLAKSSCGDDRHFGYNTKLLKKITEEPPLSFSLAFVFLISLVDKNFARTL